jgi:hypothetical protein
MTKDTNVNFAKYEKDLVIMGVFCCCFVLFLFGKERPYLLERPIEVFTISVT